MQIYFLIFSMKLKQHESWKLDKIIWIDSCFRVFDGKRFQNGLKMSFLIFMTNRRMRFYFLHEIITAQRLAIGSNNFFVCCVLGKVLFWVFRADVILITGQSHLWVKIVFLFRIRWVIYFMTLPIIKSDYGTKCFRKAFVLQSRSCL